MQHYDLLGLICLCMGESFTSYDFQDMFLKK